MAAIGLRVLTWNLMHGRSVPPAGRELFEEFADALAGWEWDVALLQEVPPWWPGPLAARLEAEERHVLTSRNGLLALRRAIAVRSPDLIKSNGGGSNAIVVHGGAVAEHRVERLGRLPERRRLHAVRLSSGAWIGNLHTQASLAQAARAGATMLDWAAGAPAVLGGDFNLAAPELPGFAPAGGHGVDHVYAGGGLVGDGPVRVLNRDRLSDHAPVSVRVIDLPQ